MRRAILLAAVCLPVAVAAQAQEVPYRDDRSDPAALIASYYSAVNRKEYSRAWSYYGEDKPAPDLDTFIAGYETTESVELALGAVTEEGAAGSTYYQIAVAIRANETGGAQAVFAGCYTARLANPAIQGEPFQPMHIVSGTLEEASGPLEDAVPEQCGDAPGGDRDAELDEARAMFAAVYGADCPGIKPGSDAPAEPERHVLTWHYSYDDPAAPANEARLYRFFCDVGAYNEVHAYFIATALDGLRPLHFAEPELDIRYENDDTEGKVEEIRTVGFQTADRLVNSFYDPETHSIRSFAKWRGVGDASASGQWLFRQGRFTLVKYEVDASYDGEINPGTVLDYDMAP